jgi:hypothetical protein
MKICQCDRYFLYAAVAAAFKELGVSPCIAELGVLRGDNALKLYQHLDPSHMYLIDSWSNQIENFYSPFEQLQEWVKPLASYSSYFGGPTNNQSTFDRLYAECQSKFSSMPNVSLIREETMEAAKILLKERPNTSFDFIYIDANHQYEFVLRDLIIYERLVHSNGVLMLNDCCHSIEGMKQNMGVLEAVTNFVKRSDFVPVAITQTDFTDVVLARKGSAFERKINQILMDSRVSFVEIPDSMISAAEVINGQYRTHISFI